MLQVFLLFLGRYFTLLIDISLADPWVLVASPFMLHECNFTALKSVSIFPLKYILGSVNSLRRQLPLWNLEELYLGLGPIQPSELSFTVPAGFEPQTLPCVVILLFWIQRNTALTVTTVVRQSYYFRSCEIEKPTRFWSHRGLKGTQGQAL